ncbi:MAG: hypothetical protein V2B13_16410 [Pseudomonadota bacterium]
MTYLKIFLIGLMLSVLGMAGCSSNSAVSSGFGTGGGYSINLTATQTNIPQGGSTTLIASVRDAQGNPVNDSTRGVTFTSSIGATITQPASIIGGVSSTTYTAPTAANTATPGIDQVTASYLGASAFVSIYVYKP